MKKGLLQFQNEDNSYPFNINPVTDHPLILDGAMGSYLHISGYKPDPVLWFSHLNIENPDAVLSVHKAYIEAGADIITTNTFRTNPAAVDRQIKYNSDELVKSSLDIAKKAVSEYGNILIAGSNPPAEDSYQKERKISNKDLYLNHSKHIELLSENGCDFILNETQSHLDEIKIICEFCSKENIPFVVSLFFDEDFRILSGEPVSDVIEIVKDYAPLAIGFNCISIRLFKSFLEKKKFNFNWGFYLNYGLGKFTDSKITGIINPGSDQYVIKLALKGRASFIGGCCGSGPEHIHKIRSVTYGNYNT